MARKYPGVTTTIELISGWPSGRGGTPIRWIDVKMPPATSGGVSVAPAASIPGRPHRFGHAIIDLDPDRYEKRGGGRVRAQRLDHRIATEQEFGGIFGYGRLAPGCHPWPGAR